MAEPNRLPWPPGSVRGAEKDLGTPEQWGVCLSVCRSVCQLPLSAFHIGVLATLSDMDKGSYHFHCE